MIPETSAQQRVELYRAVDFPGSWRHEATLLDGLIASDATVLEHDGRLWMFVCVTEPHAMMLDELHLFSAQEPAGALERAPAEPRRLGRAAGASGRRDPVVGLDAGSARAGRQPPLRRRGVVQPDRRADA